MIDAFLLDLVSIERATTSASSTGEVQQSSEPWPIAKSGVRASVQPRSGSFRQSEYGRAKAANYRGMFRPAEDVRVADRIKMADGTRYEVTFVAKYPEHIEADLALVVAL